MRRLIHRGQLEQTNEINPTEIGNLLQNSTVRPSDHHAGSGDHAHPEWILQRKLLIYNPLSGDIFMNPNGSTVDSLIKEVIQQILGTGLLGDWPTLYGVMQQVLFLEDTSGTLWKTVDFLTGCTLLKIPD